MVDDLLSIGSAIVVGRFRFSGSRGGEESQVGGQLWRCGPGCWPAISSICGSARVGREGSGCGCYIEPRQS
jgi:hypothetical protein